ncbi:Vancomycin resistance protein YoaR, contains peptidoglycan-binding and VanW domains [Selenomonas ruminantium]|uniref:Vancomycin resistance protein YoaR, contains peptidoglycan-binding and VanW domains n=1 Tax=Selenomonas ruminantium TaxID=971 RepID=A0A1M6UAR6_SELRU|nr:VanW family protein [Selenomonas ruminantium]SHK66276.1 Vancomycin resistance protein YoaR, contains peptidoglycan-binding and VanW domains [Selenomonas ruminantium]
MNISTTTLGKIVTLTALGTVLTIAIAGSISVSVVNQDKIIMGVQAYGTTIAGMNKNEARKFFSDTANSKLQRKAAVLNYEERTFHIDPADINLHGNVDEAVEAAYRIGREGTPLQNLISQMRCAIFGQTITMDASYDEQLLTNQLLQIKNAIDTPPVNGVATLQADGSIKKTAAVTGLTLDIDPIAAELAPEFKSLNITVKKELTPEKQPPFIQDADLAAMDGILGSYTTRFYPGDRGDNIGLAASHLQGALIRSGSTLSFNSIVGPRTRDAGYKNAGVIIYGEHAIDVGGGVCQVSSTLYNAVLLAGLTPIERTGHFAASSYVPAGRDATVADGLIDFVFRNPLPHPVYLTVSNTGNALTIYVLGTRSDLNGKSIALITEGSSQHPSVYRLWKQDGQVIEREFLHTDTYETLKNT